MPLDCGERIGVKQSLRPSSVDSGISKAAHPVEWLSYPGSAYIAKDTLDTATALGLPVYEAPDTRYP